MSEMKNHTIKLLGKKIQQGDDQRKYFRSSEVFRYEGDEISLGKKAMANLRANPAAMSRSANFHETS
uniref:Uncharacterized protein n=1 Tax=Tanacetum cinerariifolium TaxID=118510 RepID=A0A699GGV7_TANCI|nr:hypothetical protein [Tanacetum cinerariifolium]